MGKCNQARVRGQGSKNLGAWIGAGWWGTGMWVSSANRMKGVLKIWNLSLPARCCGSEAALPRQGAWPQPLVQEQVPQAAWPRREKERRPPSSLLSSHSPSARLPRGKHSKDGRVLLVHVFQHLQTEACRRGLEAPSLCGPRSRYLRLRGSASSRSTRLCQQNLSSGEELSRMHVFTPGQTVTPFFLSRILDPHSP